MTNCETMSRKNRILKRLYSATALLIVSAIMLVTASYAWYTLSTSPEAKGISTSFAGNGSLEIALVPSNGNIGDITSGRGASAAFAGGYGVLTESNCKWGNIINLADNTYGLDLITLRPSRINADSDTGAITGSVLSVPEWSYDGRITVLRNTYAASHYIDDDFSLREGFKGNRYGVRAVVDEDENTYGFVTDLAFRLNTENSSGEPGKLLLQTEGISRAYSNDESDAFVGGGSTLRFSDIEGNEVTNSSDGYDIARRFINCIRIAFIADFGNAEDSDYSVLAYARADEDGNLYICNRSGARINGEGANVILSAMQKNRIYQVSVLVWLDGDSVTAADVEMSPHFLSTAVLNLQFATDVSLTPVSIETNTVERVVVSSGSCGVDAVYELDNFGVLTVSGTGNVGGYDADNAPWKDHISSIKEIVVESGITGILENAFAGCTNLTTVTIPAGITAIGENAFGGCTGLTRVNFGGTIAEWNAIPKDGNPELAAATVYCTDGVIYVTDNSLYGMCGDRVRWSLSEEGLLKIFGQGAMYDYGDRLDVLNTFGLTAPWVAKSSSIKAVIIDDGVTYIGSGSFYSCDNLKEVNISNTVEGIGSLAFSSCDSLISIDIPDSVTDLGSSAFYNCKGLKAANIGNGVDEIKDYTFFNCDNLENAYIGNSVTSINMGAFSGCQKLSEIVIPNSVEIIDQDAFEDCYELSNVVLGENVVSIGLNSFARCRNLSEIVIPDSVTSIGAWAFSGCSNLSNIFIPHNVTVIHFGAFSSCDQLESIVVAENNTVFCSRDNCLIEIASKTLVSGCKNSVIPNDGSVTVIGREAFCGCTSITTIPLPNCIEEIGQSAFDQCTNLSSIDLPSSVEKIGSGAFGYCSLEVIIIPDSVTNIGSFAFVGCSSLTDVRLSESITSISSQAFIDCFSLKSIIIPDNVTSISWYAFDRCTNLETVTIPASVTNIDHNAFSDCSRLISINYGGTTEQWNGIEKGSFWDNNTGDYMVHCTDGDIPKS